MFTSFILLSCNWLHCWAMFLIKIIIIIINGHTGTYFEFLIHDLPALLLENLSANNQTQDIWLEQDGVPDHFSQQVTAMLNNTY